MSWIFAGVVDPMYTGTPSGRSLLQVLLSQQDIPARVGAQWTKKLIEEEFVDFVTRSVAMSVACRPDRAQQDQSETYGNASKRLSYPALALRFAAMKPPANPPSIFGVWPIINHRRQSSYWPLRASGRLLMT
jgi:hypothetical protein